MNTGNRIGGSGKVTFLGVTVASGDITITLDGQPKPVATVTGGADAAHFQGGAFYTISFTPVCDALGIVDFYNAIAALSLSQAITPRRISVASINTGTEVITTDTPHELATADAVRVARGDSTWPTLSSGTLSASTVYYARNLSASTLSLHPTANDATNNTNALNFTAYTKATFGPFYIVQDVAAVVHFADNQKWTFHNCGIETVPEMTFAGTELALSGALTIRAFVKTGSNTNDRDAIYTRTIAAYTPPSEPTGSRLTSPALVSWGTALVDMESETPIKLAIAPQFADLQSGINGVVSRILTGLKATLTLRPSNITTTELETALALANGVGAEIEGFETAITATAGAAALTVTLPFMMVNKATLVASIQNQRIGDVAFELTTPQPGTWFIVV